MIVWIIGLSASGKTALGNELINLLRATKQPWVYLDGDTVRRVYGEDVGHTIDGRRVNSERMRQICGLLDRNNINVLACILSIFPDHQENNRKAFSNYKEIYLAVDMENLIRRDNKGIYRKARAGNLMNVVGVDIPFVPPAAPDIVIDNNREGADMVALASQCFDKLGLTANGIYQFSDIDCLLWPQTYQYTRFLGKPFLDSFLLARSKALEGLNERAMELGGILAEETLAASLAPSGDTTYRPSEETLTSDLLSDAWRCLREKRSVPNELWILLRRFEVSKKIFSAYRTADFRRTTEEYRDYVLYPMFGVVLASWYLAVNSKNEKLLILNALLKVNDVVASLVYRFVKREPLSAAWYSLSKEISIVRDLIGSQL